MDPRRHALVRFKIKLMTLLDYKQTPRATSDKQNKGFHNYYFQMKIKISHYYLMSMIKLLRDLKMNVKCLVIYTSFITRKKIMRRMLLGFSRRHRIITAWTMAG